MTAALDFFCRERSESRLRYRTRGFAVNECRRCGLAFAVPQPSSDEGGAFASHGAGYSPYRKEKLWWRCALCMALHPRDGLVRRRDFIGRFRDPALPTRFLDVGCWDGRLLQHLRDRYPHWDLTGVEPAAAGVEAAQRLGQEVLHGVLEEAAFPGSHFDVVFAWNVLEHVPDPPAFVTEVARVLRPQGVFVGHAPNYGSLIRRLQGARWKEFKPYHLYHFGCRTLERLLTEGGLQVLSSPRGLAKNLGHGFCFAARKAA